ncbi:MAG: hypothetical protein IMZ71_04805 [Chloroflexi bacterium]|nr:hypothetical protein [Chloroflexota bacterium]
MKSVRMVKVSERQWIVVVRGWGFVTRSNLLKHGAAVRLTTRLRAA